MAETHHSVRALLTIVAALVVVAGPAAAQTLNDQATALVGHVDDQADAAREDPEGLAANATNATWQGEQVNFTKAWTCETATVANGDVGGALGELGLCPALADENAAPEDEDVQADNENETLAQADELGNDAETAVEDQAAATEELVTNLTEDPENATSALETYLNRTLTFLRRLVGLPAQGLDAAGNAVGAVAGAIADVGHTIGGAAGDAVVAVAGLFAELGTTVVDAAKATWAGAAALVEETFDALGETARSVGDGLGSAGELVGDALGAVVSAVKDLVPGGGDDLPVRGGHGPLRGVGDTTRSLTDGIELPVEV